ncbi:winged helix-turn-helix domain-containing protein [Paraburkholderia sp. GAS199]|uniref:winged helix-turn-helix domain-containing protein n=1 Tax=Paraburkholderia sp. GAS199 TaxID=3035126 RepID=UPI003D25AD75
MSLELRSLLSDGQPLRLGARTFDVLKTLITADGRIVSKNELLDVVWAGMPIEASNIQVQIALLRKLMGRDGDFIKTIPGRGYCLIRGPRPDDLSSFRFDNIDAGGHARGPNPLPPLRAPLIGRQQALHEVAQAVGVTRLVTLVGAGGIGKSQLALHVAHRIAPRFTDVRYIDFSALRDARLTQGTLYENLPGMLARDANIEALLCSSLHSRRLLVVIDNCELVIEEAEQLCARLLDVNPTARIIATSQEPLRCSFGSIYRVLPLELPPPEAEDEKILESSSIQMFISCARARKPDFLADLEQLKLVALVCRRLDGLPLALELAATTVTTLGLGELVTRLNNRFPVLTQGLRTAPLRQKSLRATLDWSYKFLCAHEREVLRWLSKTDGCFKLSAARHIAPKINLTTAEVVKAISGLARKSFLTVNSHGSTSRFHVPENVRAYVTQVIDGIEEVGITLFWHGGAGLDSRSPFNMMVPERQQKKLAMAAD